MFQFKARSRIAVGQIDSSAKFDLFSPVVVFSRETAMASSESPQLDLADD
jgi:hypothetical protein